VTNVEAIQMTTSQDYQAAPIRDAGEWSARLEPLRLRHVVVGIDGSPNSVEALRVAGRLAVRDRAKVEAVCVYRPYLHTPYPLGTVTVPAYGPTGEGARDVYASPGGVLDAAADAHATLEQAARDAFGTQTLPNLVLRAIDSGERSVHEVLTTMAAAADLLVVGARGHSGPLGMLLGSTAQSCTRHAKCSVLVVPAAR
jgi:nucleotide-binding universal stress UspA family protein